MKVNGKTAIVTGASSGIGRGTAVALAKRGCNLALVARSAEQLEETRKLVEPYGVKVSLHIAELGDRAQIDALPEKILAEHEAVDLLFNIAGVCAGGSFTEISDEAFDRVMNINFMSTAYMMKRFLPHLLTRPEAHIVNMSSVQGVTSFAGDSAYSASKFAVRGLSNAVRFELGDNTNVHVSYVVMGGVNSNIILHCIPLEGLTEEQKLKAYEDAVKFAKRTLTMDPMEAGEGVVRGTEKDQPRIIVGRDAHRAVRAEHFHPVNYWPIIRKWIGR